VIIPLVKKDDNTWTVPSFTYLTDAQYIAYVDGISMSTCTAPPIRVDRSASAEALIISRRFW